MQQNTAFICRFVQDNKLLCNQHYSNNQGDSVIVKDKKSLLIAISKYSNDLNFQHGNKSRIGALLSLKDVCSYYESLHFHHIVEELGFPQVRVNIISFFSHVKNICEQSLMFFICSEVSNSIEARPIHGLIDSLIKEGYYDGTINVQGKQKKIDFSSFNDSLENLRDLFVNRYDNTVGSHMLDFQISIFSAFECWITKLCEHYKNEMDETYTRSRISKSEELLKEYEKLLKNENNNPDENRCKHIQNLRKIPGDFISFPDKFNFILKKLNKNNYSRDIKSDRELVNFLRAARNSVHNGGIHHGNDITFTHNGISHKLINKKGMYSDNYNTLIDLCAALVDIYESILSSLKSEVRLELICSIAPLHEDV